MTDAHELAAHALKDALATDDLHELAKLLHAGADGCAELAEELDGRSASESPRVAGELEEAAEKANHHATRLRALAQAINPGPYATELAALAANVASRYPDDAEAQRVAEYATQVVRDH